MFRLIAEKQETKELGLMISKVLKAFNFYRLVGEITGFRTAKKLVLHGVAVKKVHILPF